MYDGFGTKALMGENAVHIPFNFVRMDADGTNGFLMGQETGRALSFKATRDFVLVKGDMIFRPHLVIESNHPRGVGVAGIITSSIFANEEEWRDEGKVLFDMND